jgi:hypothetical protein
MAWHQWLAPWNSARPRGRIAEGRPRRQSSTTLLLEWLEERIVLDDSRQEGVGHASPTTESNGS